MRYCLVSDLNSRSFPVGDKFLDNGSASDTAEVMLYSGRPFQPDNAKVAILIELGNECLIEHLGEENQPGNVLGFARYRNGDDPPSRLVELVVLPNTANSAIDAARAVFAKAGLETVISTDQPGRIINRLVAPKYNAALRFLDEGLATQKDMDLTCKLGLGYPDGPIERIVRGGLEHHGRMTRALFEAFGTPAYAPPRRAIAAVNRASEAGGSGGATQRS